MKADLSIYNSSNRIETALKNLKQNKEISERNKGLIIKFYEESAAQGISVSRLIRYVYILTKTAKLLKKDFDTVTKDDMVKVIGDIEKENYAEWTKHTYKTIIKKFIQVYHKMLGE